MADENVELFAHIGRKQIEIDNAMTAFSTLTNEYTNLLLVLSNVLDGKIQAEHVSVNLEARSWAIAPESTPPQKVVTKVIKPAVRKAKKIAKDMAFGRNEDAWPNKPAGIPIE